MAPDGLRAMPGTRVRSYSWKWWPGTDRFAKRIRTCAACPEGEDRRRPIRVSRTIDTRILSSSECPVRRGEAKDREAISVWPTEPARPTEPIPNRNPEFLILYFGSRSGSTCYANRERTVSERFDETPLQARLVIDAADCQPEDRRDFGVDFSSTSAIRVCQPGPVAFQLAITSGGSRSDRSRRGCCNFGRPLRTSFSPRYRSAPAIHSSVISGGSFVIDEVRTEPFRFALMTMPHADDAPGRTARCPDEHDQS